MRLEIELEVKRRRRIISVNIGCTFIVEMTLLVLKPYQCDTIAHFLVGMF